MNNSFPVAVLVVLLSGCSGGSSAIVDTLKYATSGRQESGTPRLSPDFSYLRVTVQGRPLFLARGSIDSGLQGTVEVWYSSEREVIRLQNGRVAGAAGATTEWRNVMLPPLPSWHTLAAEHTFKWTRVRDVMPGYRFGVSDSIVTSIIEPPEKTALIGLDPKSLTWFEEKLQDDSAGTSRPGSSEALPPARYAVAFSNAGEQVMYGEQCLARSLCFTWQRWPPQSSPNDNK